VDTVESLAQRLRVRGLSKKLIEGDTS